MTISVTTTGDEANVNIVGSLNFALNEEFEALMMQLNDVKKNKVTFNLSGVTQIDSVGLGLLYIAHEDITASGAKLVLSAPSVCVDRLLELTESEKTFVVLR